MYATSCFLFLADTSTEAKESIKAEKADDAKSEASTESKSSTTTEKSKCHPPPSKRSRLVSKTILLIGRIDQPDLV